MNDAVGNGYVVVLSNDDREILLDIRKVNADHTSERVGTHVVSRSEIADFADLDAHLSEVGYRRTGDWFKKPDGGGIADVEPLSEPSVATVPLEAVQNLAHTHGGMSDRPWRLTGRPGLVDGLIVAGEYNGNRFLIFTERHSGQTFTIPAGDITAARKVASVLNSVVDVDLDVDGQPVTFCLVGPRGRMRKVFAALGHAIG